MLDNLELFQECTGDSFLGRESGDSLLELSRDKSGKKVAIAYQASCDWYLVVYDGSIVCGMDKEVDAKGVFDILTGDYPSNQEDTWRFLLDSLTMPCDTSSLKAADKEYAMGLLLHLYARHVTGG